jgi:hypothetical protein
MDDWEWIQQAQTVGSGEQWCAMQERDTVTNSFSKMIPPNAVHHVYHVVFSTLVPRAKLQSGVSLAVLWRAVLGLSFVFDTEHGLRGANLWLPSWDFLKEFVKSRNENTRRSSNRNWIRWQDIFVPIYHIRETCVWGTSKHKQRGKHALWDRQGYGWIETHQSAQSHSPDTTAVIPSHNDPTQVSPVPHSCLINSYFRADDSGNKQNTPLG